MHWDRIYFLFDVSILNIKRGFVLLSFLNALCYTKEKIGRKEGTAVEIILWIIDLLIPSAFLLLGLYFTIAPVKERNKTKGSIDTLIKLCNIYNITPNDLLSEYIYFDIEKSNIELAAFYSLSVENQQMILDLISFFNQKEKHNK